ncbi:hypothetical protein BO94DRAFT_50353 [Aspergillus sclerotioniger CBS 115572]|uniref:Uncharacterized protein n=1 Tax=Aspergillus sclerotioniger CBS 115572 TaxID=1450535 RepID=A0A317WQN9_9EURO|nr:hypothetical protein BO94DRAFT_50353 [Aspergillus sclerotioniger CBS 115572]PWY88743.1 hypothetical protein BO94DRAFT_50353 [Aspergillus sclerotioniger CBS 115572]
MLPSTIDPETPVRVNPPGQALSIQYVLLRSTTTYILKKGGLQHADEQTKSCRAIMGRVLAATSARARRVVGLEMRAPSDYYSAQFPRHTILLHHKSTTNNNNNNNNGVDSSLVSSTRLPFSYPSFSPSVKGRSLLPFPHGPPSRRPLHTYLPAFYPLNSPP